MLTRTPGYSVSFGIFQEYYSNDSDIYGSPGAFASIGAAQVGVMYLLMPVIFVLLHRRPRWRPWCGRLGLVITMASISASAFVSTVHGLIATQGVVYALGCALLFSPVSVYMDEWFVRSKGAAYGVMWGGKSAVGVGMPFVFNAMLSRFGLSITLLSWAVASGLLSLPALLLMKPRLPLPASGDARGSRPLSWRFFRCTTFWMMQLGVVIQSLGYMMPSTYLASYALAIGLPSVTGPLLLAAFSLASVPGSIIHGFVGDKVSASKAILVSSFGSALPVFLLWGLSLHFANVMAFALAFGFFAGGFSSTWSGMVSEIQKVDASAESSIVFGMLLGGRGLGFVLSGPVSGALLSSRTRLMNGTLGYATIYGPMIIFTGITAVLGAWGAYCVIVEAKMLPWCARRDARRLEDHLEPERWA